MIAGATRPKVSGPKPRFPAMPQLPASDPGATALSDAELDRLAELLEAHVVPGGGMSLEMIDGFFSALAVAPVDVPFDQAEAVIWGDSAPLWPSAAEAGEVHALLARHRQAVDRRVRTPARELATLLMPVLAYPDEVPEPDDRSFPLGAEWASGFLEAVSLRAEQWAEWESALDWLGEDLDEFEWLADGDEQGEKGPTYAEREAIVGDFTELLHVLWQQRSADLDPRTPARAEPQPGRNEPCPCGSGRKFKVCCGRPRALH